MIENIRTTYYEIFQDLGRIRKFVLSTVAVFLSGITFGILYHDGFPDVMSSFGKIAEGLAPHRGISLIGLIFLRNSTAAAIAITSGYVFGILPLLASLINGVIVGLTFSNIDISQRMTALLLLLPHGIFELPAMFISWGLGLQKGMSVLYHITGQPPQGRPVRAAQTYGYIVVPLLIIAAVIEGTMIGIMKGR